MGQLALGFRSLFFKLAIFVMLAALLAAALGGSLLPRPRSLGRPAVTSGDGATWTWELTLTGRRESPYAWRLLRRTGGVEPEVIDDGAYLDVAGPVVGARAVAWAVQGRDGDWRLEERLDSGMRRSQGMPDRLAVEWALARCGAGLVPGNGAELDAVRRAAEGGAWPVPPAGGS